MLDKLNSEQRETAAQRAAQAQERHQRVQQRCEELRDRIRNEQEVAVMYRYDDAGKRVLWTDAERIAYREQLQATNQQYCGAGQ
jgi:YD repeat-containing protein